MTRGELIVLNKRLATFGQTVMADPVERELLNAAARRYKQRKRQEARAAILAEKGVGGW